MARRYPPYTPTHNPWNIPDWRKDTNYSNPQEMSRELWRWEFLRRRKEYRTDWEKYACLQSKGGADDDRKGSDSQSSDITSQEQALDWHPSRLAAKYRVLELVHPGDPNPSIYPKALRDDEEEPIDIERGLVPFPQPEGMGSMVQVPLTVGSCSIQGAMDVTELVDEYDATNWVLEDHWGIHYVLFPQEVVLRLDLRFTAVEQLCRRVMEKFPQRNYPSSGESSTYTVPTGQTVPELGWKQGLHELPNGKGPITAPRLILDPQIPGIVHVIFDLLQPKGEQWKNAKHWLAKIQLEHVGPLPKQREDPYAWLKYLRILDAWDFNPDPENLNVTYQTIGEIILGIKRDSNKARARAKQDHMQAERLLAHFPY
jgi:transcriptional regulator